MQSWYKYLHYIENKLKKYSIRFFTLKEKFVPDGSGYKIESKWLLNQQAQKLQVLLHLKEEDLFHWQTINSVSK